ncbi:MAG: AAA family ATPase [Candidatus Raymondbacteria bacterium RifOxyC12_full_50_8]|uniref:AAA family ATPase n=1 Tax=Candidatus Raymondbacteria bacterium RIFOXYD12_FULL_49_13 TaxID=1817890 RepID=A0A1F7F9D9_UNCRA|nr:MAG: AAA family ATPase [Candidatus Raymondbacteria bacterium RIFOXYA2_FULL_49_16]OGJ91832.1 MAG: AAA family ATPase [Candidatus Raymondbacteria bacterium RifOxyB12_full_50_8]OGJ97172.1 MAG: AAA family ATPase [Candidatus Raymondbacteria bacterium RIFOXYC2_FULL_50_21]OGK03198.1 MAG: AAA family ATPase [Candidatus Raymondbacteria bacterium RIFOXYD12_FULL_49_13]OGK04957.1 MAG: AAA family ATPase [Candidatus Raymondbacteria bacterium RifOxyC12_full_50_8]OGP42903.1 MAG: AAA family ATPase [Candidatus
MAYQTDAEAAAQLSEACALIKQETGKVIVGQDRVIELMLAALFSRGHALLVGVPGLAKTMLVKTLASCLSLKFNRIQFTPDLMPSDITGTDVLEEDVASRKRVFTFIKGPVFCNILLADEINRTPPKTQAALLQAMQEGFVTASGAHHEIAPPFLVFATQNPIEQEGTYPLPEAQLDRFMFFIGVDYPSEQEERDIVIRQTSPEKPVVAPVLSPEAIIELQSVVDKVPVPEHIINYTVELVRKTRPSGSGDDFITRMVRWGAGPRASQYLVAAAKAWAILHGRTVVDITDIRELAVPVLRHRIIPNFHAEAEGVGSSAIIAHVLERTQY